MTQTKKDNRRNLRFSISPEAAYRLDRIQAERVLKSGAPLSKLDLAAELFEEAIKKIELS